MAESRNDLVMDAAPEFGWTVVDADAPTAIVLTRGEQRIEVEFGPKGNICWAWYWNGTSGDRIYGGRMAVQGVMAMFGERAR